MGLALVGPALGLLGANQSANAAQWTGGFKAQMDLQNADLAKQAASVALAQGNYMSGLAVSKGTQLAGKQTADYGASGVDVASQSAGQATSQTKLFSELDAQTIQSNAAREAWGYRVQQTQDQEQAQLDLKGGANQAQADWTNFYSQSWSSLLSAGTKAVGGGSS